MKQPRSSRALEQPGAAKPVARPPRIILALETYHADLYAGVLEYSRQRGWDLDATIVHHLGLLPTLEGCAGIIASVSGAERFRWVRDAGCPVIRLLSTSFDAPPWPAVVLDSEAIGRLGARHLLELGDTHVAFYQIFADAPDDVECRGAFVAEMEAHGRNVHILNLGIVSTAPNRGPKGRRERVDWLEERLRALPLPLAVMTADDRFAVDLVVAAHRLGWRIPEDVAILGAEDHPFIRGIVKDEISSIDVNFREVGRRACEMLDQVLQGGAPGSTQVPMLVKVPPKEIVMRQSTATFTCDHPGVTAAAQFIRENFHRPIAVADVAAHARMPIRTLQSVYPEKVGMTVVDDIVRKRLQTAETLLERSNLKLAAVAIEAGFRSDQHLCRVFQRKHGVTPQSWRRQYQAG